jgi:hypothetical protein
MRHRRLRLLAASCLGVLLALPLPSVAQEPEAIPPWGRELAEPSPAAHEAGETGESHPAFFWLQAEYLLWYGKNTNVPILLTRGQTTVPRPGALDEPGTKILYGGAIDFQDRNGARFTAGIPLGQDHILGIEAGYLFLIARSIGSGLGSLGDPVLARPFFDAVANREDSSLVTYPGVIAGSIVIRNTSFFQGAEANVSALLWQGEKNRVAALAGFRYLNLSEDLTITENTVGQAGALQFDTASIGVSDRFAVDNHFFGGQIGLRTELHFGRFQLDLLGKVALGDSYERSTVEGRTAVTTAIPINAPAGLLALSSNSGTFTRNAFAVVPELGVNLGVRVTSWLSVHAGYTLIYWSDVARPGDQIDRALNPNLIPTSLTFGAPGGPARPAPGIHSSEFYVHGLNVGLTVRY